MHWQPINTAPQETALLLAAEFLFPGDWRIKLGSFCDGEWQVFGASWTPTHWMPLPAAPDAKCRTCSGHGAVGNILTAEPCPDCTPAPAASARQVLTDSQILHLQETHVGGPAPSYPIDAADWLNFGRAVEYAALATLAAKESP